VFCPPAPTNPWQIVALGRFVPWFTVAGCCPSRPALQKLNELADRTVAAWTACALTIRNQQQLGMATPPPRPRPVENRLGRPTRRRSEEMVAGLEARRPRPSGDADASPRSGTSATPPLVFETFSCCGPILPGYTRPTSRGANLFNFLYGTPSAPAIRPERGLLQPPVDR